MLRQFTQESQDSIEVLLDDQLVSTRQGEYQKVLVKWCNRPMSNYCCLQGEKVQCFDPDLYDLYKSKNLMELDLFEVGEK